MKECSVKQQENGYGPEMALLAATRHCTIEIHWELHQRKQPRIGAKNNINSKFVGARHLSWLYHDVRSTNHKTNTRQVQNVFLKTWRFFESPKWLLKHKFDIKCRPLSSPFLLITNAQPFWEDRRTWGGRRSNPQQEDCGCFAPWKTRWLRWGQGADTCVCCLGINWVRKPCGWPMVIIIWLNRTFVFFVGNCDITICLHESSTNSVSIGVCLVPGLCEVGLVHCGFAGELSNWINLPRKSPSKCGCGCGEVVSWFALSSPTGEVVLQTVCQSLRSLNSTEP